MIGKTKICKNCNACADLITIRYDKVCRFRACYCTVHEKMTRETGVCDCWQEKEITCDLSEKRIEEAVEDVAYFIDHVSELVKIR